jgi:phosphoglycolate phosphatase-like HAD superfamily hydrolase
MRLVKGIDDKDWQVRQDAEAKAHQVQVQALLESGRKARMQRVYADITAASAAARTQIAKVQGKSPTVTVPAAKAVVASLVEAEVRVGLAQAARYREAVLEVQRRMADGLAPLDAAQDTLNHVADRGLFAVPRR